MSTVVFDVETDRLLDKQRTNFGSLRITVAASAIEGAPDAPLAYYASPARPEDTPLEALATLLDAAATVVAYNGRGFDMRVMRNHFDAVRVGAWERKLIDPFEVIRDRSGSWVKLDELLEANRLPRKAGSGTSAVEWWAAGERDKVAEYCCADVTALRSLVEMDKIRFPVKRWGGTSVRTQTVEAWANLNWAAYRRSLSLLSPV